MIELIRNFTGLGPPRTRPGPTIWNGFHYMEEFSVYSQALTNDRYRRIRLPIECMATRGAPFSPDAQLTDEVGARGWRKWWALQFTSPPLTETSPLVVPVRKGISNRPKQAAALIGIRATTTEFSNDSIWMRKYPSHSAANSLSSVSARPAGSIQP